MSSKLSSVLTVKQDKAKTIKYAKVVNDRLIYLTREEKKQMEEANRDWKQKVWRPCHICKTGTTYLSKPGYITHLHEKHNIWDEEKCEAEAETARLWKGDGEIYPLEGRSGVEAEVNRVERRMELLAEGVQEIEDVDQKNDNQETSGDFQASQGNI